MKVVLFGATGLVGEMVLKVMEERDFPITELIPIASPRSVGKNIIFKNREWQVVSPEAGIEMGARLAIFSAGGEISLKWAPLFAERGCYVVDNSSAWRMDPAKKLVIPEINGNILEREDKIISNPNCSTIQMLMALAPLHRKYTVRRVIVSTYQAITGTGMKAVEQMKHERDGIMNGPMAYPYIIDQNCIPQCDDFLENGYTKEEMKLVNETHKILDPTIVVSPTAVRVPVIGGHSESLNIELEKPFAISDIKELLTHTEGVTLQDNPSEKLYPMPRYSHNKDEVFVGRIRQDISNPQALNMWVVADNLRKGAATNSVQIAELILKRGFLS